MFGQSTVEYPPANEAGGCDISLIFRNLNEETHKGTGSVFYTPMAGSGNDAWLGGLQGMDKVKGVFEMPQVDGSDALMDAGCERRKEALFDYFMQVPDMTESEAITKLAEIAG